jgi:hypothetical protein
VRNRELAPVRRGIDVDKPSAAAAASENDFTMMKVRQFSTMTDTDDGCVFEFLPQHPHNAILTRCVEGCGRFVEHDDIRAMEQDSRERQPLFLATRQDLIPGLLLLIEAFDEVAESTFSNTFATWSTLRLSAASG